MDKKVKEAKKKGQNKCELKLQQKQAPGLNWL